MSNLFSGKNIKYCLIFLICLTFIWAAIGIIDRTIDFWDDDETRGATFVEQELFGQNISEIRYLQQGWEADDSLWFYSTTQGSNLLPYDFFLELEQATSQALFRSPDNINKYRYLVQKPTFSNPEGLPVGMAKDSYQDKLYMGFTCAACHTSQVNYQGVGIRIDGGPSAADFERFMLGMQESLISTQTNADKRARFVEAVLERGNYDEEEQVISDLDKYSHRITSYNVVNRPSRSDRPLTHYGYSRLDAFGRIFNRVLENVISPVEIRHLLKVTITKQKYDSLMVDIDPILDGEDQTQLLAKIEAALTKHLSPKELLTLRNKVFNPADAPVSYPFLWDIPQHDYVQWNGIVGNAGIGPMGRNAGQVIGVFGALDWERKDGFSISALLGGQGLHDSHISFKSSIDIRNLRRVESQLRSLQSPFWPEDILGKLDSEAVYRGKKVFDRYCDSCHERIDSRSPDRRVIAHMGNVKSVKTDPKMADNSVDFDGYSGILKHNYVDTGLGNLLMQEQAPAGALLTQATKNTVTTPDPDKIFIQRWAERAFDIVTSFFDNEIQPSLKVGDYTPDTTAKPFASLRSYKARSLNGIWATAPYLHNGSVPTLYDLLLPKRTEESAEDGNYRPDFFQVGSREFDPKKVGFVSEDYQGFEFNTRIAGNSNAGHEYAAGKTAQADGTILPALSEQQRWDLVEYLKSL